MDLKRIFGGLVPSVLLGVSLFGGSVAAQGTGLIPVDEVGVCENGAICGPTGALTLAEPFPSVIDIDWAAFPVNPARPYAPAAGGRTWQVAPGGDDAAAGTPDAPLATIEQALELAVSGDVIWVADGEYPVGRFDDSLIMTTPGVTLAAEHVGGVTLVPLDDDWTWLAAINAQADDLVIDGFVIQGFTRGSGVFFGRLDSPQRGLVLRHLRIDGVGDALRSAIPEQSPNAQPVIAGLLVYDVAIRNALIGFNCGEGPCDDIRLEALDVVMPGVGEGSGADAVAIENGDNIVVFNAHITGAAADGLDFKAMHVAVANVIVHDVARNGIKLWHDGDVINALVYHTGADAALVFDAGGTYHVLNSVIARHAVGESAYAGTVSYDHPQEPGSLSLVNSIFYENSGALWVSGAFALDAQATLFYGAVDDQELIWSLPDEVLIGEMSQPPEALATVGGGNLLPFHDPGFVDPLAGDYHLAADAYAHDRGVSEGIAALPDFDLAGNPRLAGAAIDLGPYEQPD
jgi:hypothetical protein